MAPETSHRRSPGPEVWPARGVNEVRTGLRRNPLGGPVSTGKGVPGDGDALLIIIQPKPIHDNRLRIVTDEPEIPTSDAMQRPKREGLGRQPGRIAPGLTRLPPLGSLLLTS